ncbi:MAG TPA: ferritin-like domain-containing protein [Gaiellales bacterium]|nr:ferritin-like domain-containing protein [Gaiellales bacterium]
MAEGRSEAAEHTASRRAVLSGASLVAAGIIVGGVGAPAIGSGSRLGDAEILNFALEMEELQAALYEQALRHAGLTGELAQYARVVGGHEREHVAFLRQTLGSRAKPAPAFDFGDAVTDPDRFAAAARVLEDLGVAALDGQAANLTKPSLAAVATIVSVEARHAAWIRDLLGELPAPTAANPSEGAARVIAAIRRTGYVKASA